MAKSKPWTRGPKKRAAEGTRKRRRVLIYCEDSKSSADYLNCFPTNGQRVEVKVVGTGMNTDSLIKAAVKAKQKAITAKESYSEVWCVFDRDSFPLKNYAAAFSLAKANNIELAWTNEAFELWYLLHFDYIDAAISRKDYAKMLADRGLVYEKADGAFYEKIKNRQEIAIRNAKKLERYWNETNCPSPERENPSTRVHVLVELLIELAELD
ncbi:RloB family protein [Granulicella aggregans]|jgi:hypothetical protein|uniref:RloB family protein n=1 Tax=Granulicella aggregans TaxID=474949 RepID=UPI0021DFF40C|nr:RloB family protein [Granulicella aggregans]